MDLVEYFFFAVRTGDFIDKNGNTFSIKSFLTYPSCNGYQASYYNGALVTNFAWVNSQLLGYDESTFAKGILMERIFYESSTNSFVVANAASNCEYLGEAGDFDDSAVTVRFRFGKYVKTSAQVFVFNLIGLTGTTLSAIDDNEPPIIEIDYGGYLKDSLPTYAVGE